MDKRRFTYMTIGFIVLLAVVLLLTWGGYRQSGGIVLPESPADASGTDSEETDSRLNAVVIDPETVHFAVGALSRPSAYSRSQTVETFWSGGSGSSVSQVYVSGQRTRFDTALPDGSTRHMLVDASSSQTLSGVWYDDETEWTKLSSQALTADQAGRMLTYETVRDLPPASIALADYREEYGENCIYVETLAGEDGYQDRYWVSVDSGLLIAAERLWEETLIYRFTTGNPDISPQEESLFLLPDGSVLAD